MASINEPDQLARINPDSKAVLYLVLGLTTVIAAVAFAVSFAGLAAVSAWAQIPPWLSWGLPVFVDGAILVFTIMILVFRSRGESTVFAWVVLIAFTLISVGANAAHAYAEGVPEEWRTIVGSGLAGLAPAGLAVFIHGIARLLVTPSNLAVTTSEAPTPVVEMINAPTLKGDGHEQGSAQQNNGLLPTKSTGALAESIAPPQQGILRTEGAGMSMPSSPVGQGAVTESLQKNLAREEQIKEAIALSSKGVSQVEIGKLLGVSRATIGRWLRANREPVSVADHLFHVPNG